MKNDVKIATAWYEKVAVQGMAPLGKALALTYIHVGKNAAVKGAIAVNHQAMRLSAAKQIPTEYANRILLTK